MGILSLGSHSFPLFLTILLIFVPLSVQLSLTEYLTLNHEQKVRLDEFRERVIKKVPYDYMRENVYLIRWLRDKDFDVDVAERFLFKHIAWRKENNIDTILEEDWDDFNYDFKVTVEGCDFDGKPIFTLRVGDWDIRKYVLAGKGQKLMRYVDKILEETDVMLRKMRSAGENVTQTITIYELSNFNLVQQGCAPCLPVLYHIAQSYTANYVGTLHKLISVNTPQIAIPIWAVIKTFLSKHLGELLYIYGKDTSEWRAALLTEIDENQLSKTFGGTKAEALDIEDLRTTNDILRCSNL